MNQAIVNVSRVENEIERTNRHIWEVMFFYDPFEEDNDSEELEDWKSRAGEETEDDESDQPCD